MGAPLTSSSLPSPVLVLGATSLIGGFVLERLRGTATVAVSRTAHPKGDAAWVTADIAGSDLARQLPACPTVLGLCPIWLLPRALPQLKTAGMRRLVAFSSTSVVTKAASSHPHERDTARRLAQGEQAIRSFCEANGIAWTILRPTLIYVEGRDQNVSRLASVIRKLGFLPLAGRGEGLRQPVHADDLATAALAAAAAPAAAGRAYDVPGGETLTYRKMVERIFEGLDRRPRIIAVPETLWALGLTLASPFIPGATANMGARMSEDLTFDPEPARRDFGWNPRAFHPKFS